MIHIFEFIGMLFSMIGAFYMSMDKEKDPKHMWKAFHFFGISNIAVLMVASYSLIVPLYIQMVLFMTSTLVQLKEYYQKTIVYGIYLAALIISLILMFINYQKGFVLSISNIEVIAAICAITGSFLLKTKDKKILLSAFILFLIADSIYSYVGYKRELWYFMLQSIFFLYTSIRGILNLKLLTAIAFE